MTGYTDKTMSSALQYLKEDGVIDFQSTGWLLCEGVQLQLPSSSQDEKCRNNSGTVNYLSKEVVAINNLNNTSTDLLNTTPQIEKTPPIEKIRMVLDAAADLFGHPILGETQDYADIDRLLSWIAQAYQGSRAQGKLKVINPAGLIYWAFHQGKNQRAEKKYLDLNLIERYLTESFMRASGLWEFEQDEDEEMTK
jgi:hypothetical protein